ncbi:myb/sant-like dna-binding domain [Holotrichia oblita]|uniref:Myb/sant-like dna-binding domain n=1 Tax=Holotrichia oblita TaxID=644536 RepID=A0ACB9TGX2_HOLOL|nr:myb/sant-like dna-binding domain [Holotrichia oblita]
MRHLIDVVIRYIAVVENKKTDAVMWSEKEKTWKFIADEFRALTGAERNVTVLRNKYDAIKHNVKAKLTRNKLQIFKTGGGSAKLETLTDYEEKLSGYISLCTSISNPENVTILAEYVVNPETNEAEVISDVNITADAEVEAGNEKENQSWTSWNPKALKRKRHSALQQPAKQNLNKNVLNDKLDTMISSRNELLELQKDMVLKDIQSKMQLAEDENTFVKQHRDLLLELLHLKIQNQKLKMEL